MELDISAQALTLLLALPLGAALGLGYDLLRPLRRRSKGVFTALLDVSFALASGAAAFVFAMGAANGRMGVWELALTLAGFLLYLHTLSLRVYPILDEIWNLAGNLIRKTKNIFQKTAKKVKFLFKKVRECFIIKDN